MRLTSRARRLISLLLGCWLAVFAAEPAALHVCEVHDVTAPASHARHHADPHAKHSCTCPGACCPGVGARLGTPPALATPRLVAFVEAAPATAPRVVSAVARVVLPPSIGPPRLG